MKAMEESPNACGEARISTSCGKASITTCGKVTITTCGHARITTCANVRITTHIGKVKSESPRVQNGKVRITTLRLCSPPGVSSKAGNSIYTTTRARLSLLVGTLYQKYSKFHNLFVIFPHGCRRIWNMCTHFDLFASHLTTKLLYTMFFSFAKARIVVSSSDSPSRLQQSVNVGVRVCVCVCACVQCKSVQVCVCACLCKRT
jgi:hypothetical protein